MTNTFIDDLLKQTISTSPKPVPKPTPTPLKPTPAPIPLKPTPKPIPCEYNPHDNLALEMRKAIFDSPQSCKTEISSAFTGYLSQPAADIAPNSHTQLPFLIIPECQTYLITQISTNNLNASSICISELFDGATNYAKTFHGDRITYLPHSSCTAYLTSFIKDFHTYPTDLVHLAGCNTTNNLTFIEVLPH